MDQKQFIALLATVINIGQELQSRLPYTTKVAVEKAAEYYRAAENAVEHPEVPTSI
jgi:hypothetical protein